MMNVTERQWTTVPGPRGLNVHICTEPIDGIRRVTDLYVYDPAGIDPDAFREIRVRRLEAATPYFDTLTDADPTLTQLRQHVPTPPKRRDRPRLTRPRGMNHETWLQTVALAFHHYDPITHRVAAEMAAEAGVPTGTVERWIREARRARLIRPATSKRS